MKIRAKATAILSSSLAFAVVASGCTTTTTTHKTYHTTIESTPEGAYVWSTEGKEGEPEGLTPLTLEHEFEVERTEANWGMASVGLLASSVLILGGGALATVGTTTTTTDGSGTSSVEESGPSEAGVGLGLVLWGALGAWWALDAMASDGDIEIEGTYIGNEEDLTEEDYLAALPDNQYRITSPGYVAKNYAVAPGSSTAISLIPDPDGLAQDSVARSAGDPSSTEKHRSGRDGTSSAVVASPQPTAYALVVGIENYRNIPATTGASDDAKRFAAMLETTFGVPQDHIHLLTDDGATRSDILAKLAWLESNVPEDSRIYFYFSGHGSPNVENGDSYLLPFEGSPETIAHSGVQLQQVLSGLGDSNAREVFAFVDACFSGRGDRSVLPEGTRPLVPVQAVTPDSKVALFSASGAKEIAGNIPGEDGGLFTYHLLEALSSGASDIDGDGRISLEEVNTFVAPRVRRDAKRASRKQNPGLDVSQELGAASDMILIWGLPTK